MQQLSIFDMQTERTPRSMPLAGRVRPKTLAEFVGQEHLLGPGCMLRTLIENDNISSMIFWGPPGVGKTTLASIIAGQTKSEFINFSAVTSGIKEIKDVMKQAEDATLRGIRTVLFVDEIHRFNKAQQDAFLPYVEKGSIILIGATTENPSFEVNGALLSRCKVFVLKPLTEDNIVTLLKHALTSKDGFADNNVKMSDDQIRAIAAFSNGDARTALNTLEMAAPFLSQIHLCDCIDDPTHPCFGDLHMDPAEAPDWKTEGFLTPEVGAEIIRRAAAFDKPEGVKRFWVSIEVLGHKGDKLWHKERIAREFLIRCWELSGVEMSR